MDEILGLLAFALFIGAQVSAVIVLSAMRKALYVDPNAPADSTSTNACPRAMLLQHSVLVDYALAASRLGEVAERAERGEAEDSASGVERAFDIRRGVPGMLRTWATLIVIWLAFSHPAFAQMPKDIADAVRAIGPIIEPAATARIYAPLHKQEAPAGVKIVRDETYGSADRHRLDIFTFTPAEPGPARPVLIYVHGGGYVRGDRRVPNTPFHDNVMVWAVANGLVGVNMTYRLAPDHAWPAGAEDVASAVAWVKANAARIGGDPQRIYLMGHSAGGTHAAAYIARPEFHKAGGVGLAGAILVSATFQLKPEIEIPGQKLYFGQDHSLWAQRSSIEGLLASRLPLLLARGEADVPYYSEQSDILNQRLCAVQRCPTYAVLPAHSHMSTIFAINTGDTSLSGPVLKFINGTK